MNNEPASHKSVNSRTKTALWRPGWHELDQPIYVGQSEKFVFFESMPEDFVACPTSTPAAESGNPAESGDPAGLGDRATDDPDAKCMLTGDQLVFFNQLETDAAVQIRSARIESIHHLEIGAIDRIDTCGLDYIFIPAEGAEIVVNAEEKPGKPVDPAVKISDWTVKVTLSGVSDPIAEED